MASLGKVSMMFLLTVCVLGGASGQETYTSDRLHCYYCPKGTMVKEDCTEDLTSSTCTPCPPHHFSDKPNGRKYCDPCLGHCPKRSKLVTECSTKTNRECHCEDGRHKYPLDSIDNGWHCFPHRKCGDEEGEVYYGNHTHNTKCEKCLVGRRFVNDSNPQHPVCQDCRHCHPGQVIKSCDQHSDAQCGDSVSVSWGMSTPTSTVNASAGGSDNASEKGPSNTDVGWIIGIVVGVVVIVGIIVFVCWRSHRNTDHERVPTEERNNTAETNDL